jgi:hypothetical protein
MKQLEALHICERHSALINSWYPFDAKLASAHIIRLWLERGVQWYWRMQDLRGAEPTADMEYDARAWLAENCRKVAAGCPVCHDTHPTVLLARASRATAETLLGAFPNWRVDSTVVIVPGVSMGRAAHLAHLRVVGTEVKRESAPEQWWN